MTTIIDKPADLLESVGQHQDPADTMRRILTRMQTAFETVLGRAVSLDEIPASTDLPGRALTLVGCTYGLDTMAKFLDIALLSDYVEHVLESLQR